MANHDSLTSLLDRETFDAEIAQQVTQALAVCRPLALLFLDIDHFKRVNDDHGHQKGDVVLGEVAGRIRDVAESKGVAYRYGGEEIVVVLPNHTRSEAIAVAERIRQVVESQSIRGVRVTASIGVAVLPEQGKTVADLVKAADTAVYDAKNLGRNLVRVFGEPPPNIARQVEPERRLPEGRLNERQRRELKSRHFQGYPIRCPDDQAILKVIETNEDGTDTTGLIIICPMCGLSDDL